jgi:kinesin family member C1
MRIKHTAQFQNPRNVSAGCEVPADHEAGQVAPPHPPPEPSPEEAGPSQQLTEADLCRDEHPGGALEEPPVSTALEVELKAQREEDVAVREPLRARRAKAQSKMAEARFKMVEVQSKLAEVPSEYDATCAMTPASKLPKVELKAQQERHAAVQEELKPVRAQCLGQLTVEEYEKAVATTKELSSKLLYAQRRTSRYSVFLDQLWKIIHEVAEATCRISTELEERGDKSSRALAMEEIVKRVVTKYTELLGERSEFPNVDENFTWDPVDVRDESVPMNGASREWSKENHRDYQEFLQAKLECAQWKSMLESQADARKDLYRLQTQNKAMMEKLKDKKSACDERDRLATKCAALEETLAEHTCTFEADRDVLRTKCAQAMADRARMSRDKAKLEDDHDVLRSENERLKAEDGGLRSKNEQLKAEHGVLRSENERLKADHDRLSREKAKLEDDRRGRVNELLKAQHELRSENERLKAEHGVLRSENERIKVQHNELRSKNEQLKAEHGVLRSENERLKAEDGGRRSRPEEFDVVCEERDRLRNRLKELDAVCERLRSKLEEFDAVCEERDRLRSKLEEFDAVCEERDRLRSKLEEFDAVCEERDGLKADNRAHQKRYSFLSSQLFKATGRVWAMARVRGPTGTDDGKSLANITIPTNPDTEPLVLVTTSTSINNKPKQTKNPYFFTHSFAPSASNSDVFNVLQPMLRVSLEGLNACIITDGQTGTGKSYTMFSGPAPIAAQAAAEIFTHFAVMERDGWSWKATCWAVEVYKSEPRDRLVGARVKQPVEVSVKDINGRTVVDGQTVLPVQSPEQLLKLMERAYANRKVAATEKNEQSSRGHLIFTVCLSGHHKGTDEKRESKLQFGDLAGGERLSSEPQNDSQTKELTAINSDRFALHGVMESYVKGQMSHEKNPVRPHHPSTTVFFAC